MIPVLYPEEIARRDRQIIDDVGICEEVLIENAAQSLFAVVDGAAEEIGLGEDSEVLIICGPGNNGADGLALARHVAGSDRPVTVLLCRDEADLNDQCRKQLAICRQIPGIMVFQHEEYPDGDGFGADLIVDAMLGTGASGELRSPFNSLVDRANRSRALRIAVDIPTGLDGRTGMAGEVCFAANHTVTMGALKPGLLFGDGPEFVGELWYSNLSLPSSFYTDSTFLLDRDAALAGLPTLLRQDHKYDRGNLLIVAGSHRMTGAAALAAIGALHAGAGLVTVAIPEEAHDSLRSLLPPEIMTAPLPSHDGWFSTDALEPLRERIDRFSAVVVGPGVGQSDGTHAFLLDLVASTTVPTVLDADAITPDVVAAAVAGRRDRSPVVITPHHGEMTRLIDRTSDAIGSDPLRVAGEVAKDTGTIVVLKGAPTVVADDRRAYVNDAGNRGMATAGAGDVLSGVIGALLAGDSGGRSVDRVATAVWCHSRAADRAIEDGESIPGLSASTIAFGLGAALGELFEIDEAEDL